MSSPEILLDARLGVRGLGIATFIDRLMTGFAATGGPTPDLWGGSGGWNKMGLARTLLRSGPFDLSPRLDPRSRKYDVVHFACNLGSWVPGPNSVLTVHDLMHRRSTRSRSKMLGRLLERCLVHAGRVVAVSSRTRGEVALAFPGIAHKLSVIPHGLRELAAPKGPWEHILAFGGAADPRKRTDLMVALYCRYQQTTPNALPLVVLARAGLTQSQRSDLGDAGARIVDSASSAEVEKLMGHAAAMLYTTREEGFGLPILEAAEFGTPVVIDASANVSEELLGRHCVRVTDTSLDGWVEGLRTAIGLGRVDNALSLPYWPSVAASYQELYRQVAG